MPAILTHRMFADETLRKANNQQLMDYATAAINLYSIGTNGPDFLFFYHPWPWYNRKKARRVTKTGSQLHLFQTEELFRTLFELSYQTKDPYYIAYTIGMIMHWALDSETHPFVYHFCGRGNIDNSIKHHQMESDIELIIAQKYQVNIRKYRIYEIADYNTITLNKIADIYELISEKVNNIQLSRREIIKSVKEFRLIERLMYDPSFIKYSFFHGVENLFHLKHLASSILISKKVSENDILNESHQTWHHPVTNSDGNESFWDLYEHGQQKAIALLNLFVKYLDSQEDITSLLAIIDNCNFITNMADQEEMKYFKQ